MPDIPGVLDTRALGALLGDKPAAAADNAPQTRPEYREQATMMMGQGLKLDDIASALRISRRGVLDLLAEAAEIARERGRGDQTDDLILSLVKRKPPQGHHTRRGKRW